MQSMYGTPLNINIFYQKAFCGHKSVTRYLLENVSETRENVL